MLVFDQRFRCLAVLIQQFSASGALVSGLASAVGCTPARLFDKLSGQVPMPEERAAALDYLLTT